MKDIQVHKLGGYLILKHYMDKLETFQSSISIK
jgi:hypothetical protein